jgi:hypothetical protein
MARTWTRAVARIALVAVVGAAPTVVVAAPAAAAGAVRCRYTFTAWPGGFVADLSITNDGPTITGWTARWTFDTPTTAIIGWAAVLTQQDAEVTATNSTFNAVIRPGQMTTFGWSATAASTSVPTDLTVNGSPC